MEINKNSNHYERYVFNYIRYNDWFDCRRAFRQAVKIDSEPKRNLARFKSENPGKLSKEQKDRLGTLKYLVDEDISDKREKIIAEISKKRQVQLESGQLSLCTYFWRVVIATILDGFAEYLNILGILGIIYIITVFTYFAITKGLWYILLVIGAPVVMTLTLYTGSYFLVEWNNERLKYLQFSNSERVVTKEEKAISRKEHYNLLKAFLNSRLKQKFCPFIQPVDTTVKGN